MTANTANEAAKIRSRVSHPIVDGDGHVLEPGPIILDYVRQIAGPEIAKKVEQNQPHSWTKAIFWGMPSGPHSLDRATATLPRLFRERLDEAGIDFGVVYSTAFLFAQHQRDDEIRQSLHRAINTYLADIFRGTEDRLVPSCVIPVFTPQEAIAELEYCVNVLGHRAATFGTEVRLATPEVEREAPHLGKFTEYVNPIALDALYDYDPLWQKCLDLKIAVASHTAARGGGSRHSSKKSFVFNHLGGFATSGDYFARCLFLDGVTRRFPELNFSFLEGGVGWAVQLYNDLFEHWEKRNVDYLRAHMDPAHLDLNLLGEMAEKYGNGILTKAIFEEDLKTNVMGGVRESSLEIDEFSRCEITEKKDIVDLFVEPFYFGCEADDAMNAVAFNTKINHFGVKLKAMFGSDIGHWDVEDITHCVPDAYRNVEKGLFTDEDFRDFMFTNPVDFFTKQNPDFFKGTIVEEQAARHLRVKAAA